MCILHFLRVAAVLALAALLLLLPGDRVAAQNKELQDDVRQIAATFKKGQKEEARKLAQILGKKIQGPGTLMKLLHKRTNGGFGVGPLDNP
jgi:outer membrane lipoprotein-sorting protein